PGPGAGAAEPRVLAGRPEVKVGLVVNRISDASFREDAWTADFDIWFRWSDPELAPGETFVVANGDLVQREKVEEHASGPERFARYTAKARVQNVFDPARFPFGDEALVIQIEDRRPDGRAVRYLAEPDASGLRRAGVP